MVAKRTCKKCDLDKFIDEFGTYIYEGKMFHRYVCKDCHRLYHAEYSKKNCKKARDRASAWYRENYQRAIKSRSDYQKANPDKIRAIGSRRKARKLQATPNWLTDEHNCEIDSFYAHARDCYLVTGEEYQVDHIVPLQGRNVCGLHVPWNLQVLPADVNRKKSNKLLVDDAVFCP